MQHDAFSHAICDAIYIIIAIERARLILAAPMDADGSMIEGSRQAGRLRHHEYY